MLTVSKKADQNCCTVDGLNPGVSGVPTVWLFGIEWLKKTIVCD